MLKAAWTIARKDLALFLRDRTGLVVSLLLPIALVTVFGFIMQVGFGGGGKLPAVELWVADNDHTPLSEQFVAELQSTESLKIRLLANQSTIQVADLESVITDGRGHHALLIPSGFEADLKSGELPRLQMYRDPGRDLERQMVGIGLMQAFMSATKGKFWVASLGESLKEAGFSEAQIVLFKLTAEPLQNVISNMAESEEPDQNADDAATHPKKSRPLERGFSPDLMTRMIPLDSHDLTPPTRPKNVSFMLAQSVSGLSVMMLMFTLQSCAGLLLKERESGVIRRLLVSAIPRAAIFWGKFLFSSIVGGVSLIILFTYGNVVFKIDAYRDPVSLCVVSLTWAACATSFGMLIACAAKTTKQAEGLATVLILTMAPLGGCWFPLQLVSLPWYGELISHCTLTRWAMNGYLAMFWDGLSFHSPRILTALSVQWGFTVVASAVALWFFRRNYARG